jgi:hypothetical protein
LGTVNKKRKKGKKTAVNGSGKQERKHDNEAGSRAEERARQQTRRAPVWECWPGCGHIEQETSRTKEKRQKNHVRQNHGAGGSGKIWTKRSHARQPKTRPTHTSRENEISGSARALFCRREKQLSTRINLTWKHLAGDSCL